MKKRTLPGKILATVGTGLLLLGLAACEKSATGPATPGSSCSFPCTGDWRFESFESHDGGPRSLPRLGVTPPSLPDGIVDVVYETQTLTATGGDRRYWWSVVSGTLPTGLSLGKDDGTITGTPREVGTWISSVEVRADGFEPGRRVVVITVHAPPSP